MSSFIDHRGDGSNKSFLIPFEYYENDQLFAYVDDRLVEIEQYNKNSIVLKDIPPSGSLVRIRRIVDVDTPFATYVTGSDLTEDTLNKNNLKLLYGIQQLNDGFVDNDFYFKQDISMGDNRIIDVADGIDDTDAVNYSQVKNLDANVKQIEQNIIRLEQQAKASKDAAGVSETNAKVSETNAKTSETNAKTSELNAKTSETNAKTSETNAKDSELLAKKYADESKSTKPDYKTIFIDTAGNIAAKDLAINGDEDDLASGRGQIGKCYSLTSSIDFNTLFKAGRYWINNASFDGSSNKPPATAGGFCDVLCNEAGSNYTKQIYHEYNKPVIYIREHGETDSGWSETWTRIITEKNLATPFTPGIVQLNNTTSSTSTSQAATAKAVKLAYDKAVEAKNAADAAASSIDPWNIFPMRVPIVVDGVTFGGSDGRRAIMPGESVARENWIICDGGSDGKGGTVPDLRGRMILGASSTYAAGSTGGSETHTHSISGTVGSTTLSVGQMPNHTHAATAPYIIHSEEDLPTAGGNYRHGTAIPPSIGGSQSHTHSLSNTSTTEEALLPPYYSLSYIIRIS